MPLIITLMLLIILWMYCANDKANISKRRNDYEKDHPPCKLQEEYLLSCEFYHRYLLEGRKDAYGDAIYDARRKIFDDGYLPSSLEMAGRSHWNKAGDNLRTRWLYRYGAPWMEPSDPPISIPNTAGYGNSPNSQGLAAWRDLDASTTALRGLKKAKYTDIGWRQYCQKIDAWYERLVLESLIDSKAVFINHHTGQVQIIYNRLAPYIKEYEEIIKKHKDEIPTYIAKSDKMKQERLANQQKETERRQPIPDRPNGRGRSYNPDRY